MLEGFELLDAMAESQQWLPQEKEANKIRGKARQQWRIYKCDEIITWRVLLSLVIILLGVYIFKKNNKG